MNAILAFIPKPVLAGVLIVSLSISSIQSCRVDNLKDENARYETAVSQCVKTNRQNKTSMDFFKLQNKQCLDGRRSDETVHANAVAAWAVERELLKVIADEKGNNIVEVFRDPDCADFAKINITDICPGMVDGLRRRAENHNRIRND